MTDNLKSASAAYKEAGVDITAGYQAVELMKEHIARTTTSGVLSGIGGFGGLFAPNLQQMEKPVLVSGTDGVGTKLKYAFAFDRHDTIGIDCVAMCVNDILCSGATPLFFLDYIACGKNDPQRIAQIVKGVSEGCVRSGAALIGGETAEMPGFYPENEYDLAGFAVGLVDEKDILDPDRVKEGDQMIALPSSGFHSNGYSLVRHILDQNAETDWETPYETLGGKNLAEAVLAPTRIYVKPVLSLLRQVPIHSMAHITGGGFYENIPRAIPDGLGAAIDRAALHTPFLFQFIQEAGNITTHDMYNTFNMGVGFVIIVSKEDLPRSLEILQEEGEEAFRLGEIVVSPEKVIL